MLDNIPHSGMRSQAGQATIPFQKFPVKHCQGCPCGCEFVVVRMLPTSPSTDYNPHLTSAYPECLRKSLENRYDTSHMFLATQRHTNTSARSDTQAPTLTLHRNASPLIFKTQTSDATPSLRHASAQTSRPRVASKISSF